MANTQGDQGEESSMLQSVSKEPLSVNKEPQSQSQDQEDQGGDSSILMSASKVDNGDSHGYKPIQNARAMELFAVHGNS